MDQVYENTSFKDYIASPLNLKFGSDTRLSHTNRKNAYVSFHATSSEKTDGLLVDNSVLFYDIALTNTKRTSYSGTKNIFCGKKLFSRYSKKNVLKNSFSDFLLEFSNLNILLEFSLLSDAFIVSIKRGSKKNKICGDVSLVLLCSQTYASLLDSATGVAGNVSFIVEKPSNSLFSKLLKKYSTKAIYSRVITFTDNLNSLIKERKSVSLAFSVLANDNSHLEVKNVDSLFNVLQENKKEENTELVNELLRKSTFVTENNIFNKALAWSVVSGFDFVTGVSSRGIWAGLPWFRDNWGRDTFIALPGILLVTGEFAQAKAVIEGFAQYQDKNEKSVTYGRIPNRYINASDVIYNTVDGSLWFIREVFEYARYTGDVEFVKKMFPVIYLSLQADLTRRTDENGFLTHGDADTWMDARVEGKQPWSPRGSRANDIQALWYNALKTGALLAEMLNEKALKETWSVAAEKVAKNFKSFFIKDEKIADCILFDGTPDFRVRPNQFMVLTVPFSCFKPLLSTEEKMNLVKKVVPELVFPYGVCSLSQNDEYFHPYHDGCAFYHKDAAYHNGTIWGWNAGFVIQSLCLAGFQETAWKLTKNLAEQILDIGCLGSMSENLNAYKDKKGNITPTGTWSQAWSVSEFSRVAWQAYLGINPDMLNHQVTLSPRLPVDWKNGYCFVSLGAGILKLEWKEDEVSREKSEIMQNSKSNYVRAFKCTWSVPQNADSKFDSEVLSSDSEDKVVSRITVLFNFADGSKSMLLEAGNTGVVYGRILGMGDFSVDFSMPKNETPSYKLPSSIKTKNWLLNIVKKGKFNGSHLSASSSVR